jgi:hypothetical protein
MKKKFIISEKQLVELVAKKVNESKYSSVANILRGGIRKSIKTISILTGENPYGEKADKQYNKEANEKLEDVLISGRYGYRKVKGSYGSLENSYIVNNISLDSAIYLGEKFKQDSIVYGEVVGSDNDEVYMTFKMVGTDPDKLHEYKKVIGSTNVFVSRDNAEDFYSEVGGRKFVLPFYDVVDKMVGPDKKVYKVEKDYSKSKWEGGKNEPSSIDISLEDELNDLQERALKSYGQTSYNLRCRIEKIIKESENL